LVLVAPFFFFVDKYLRMCAELQKSEDAPVSPRKKGLIRFNPKFSHQNGAQEQSDSSSSSSTFPKPRKYFDSADFFMREEMKNHNASDKADKKNTEHSGEKTHHSSSLASECQTVPRPDSPDSVGKNKNVVPLILLRRSKSGALKNSSDADEEPENLPTTVEVLNGPSSREIPSSSGSSNEGSPENRAESPSETGRMSPRTREEVRSLLIPRLTKTPSSEESSLITSASSPRTGSSPLKTSEAEDIIKPVDE